MAKLPVFAAGIYSKIQANVDNGVLSYPSWVYVRDRQRLAFIDQDKSINEIKAANIELVQELPAFEDVNPDTLYICNGIVYVSDGTVLRPQYQDYTARLEEITSELTALSDRVTTLEEVAHSPIQWIEL